MPIGDPMGGEAPESERGRLRRVQQVWVPVSDLEAAVEDYTEVLRFTLVSMDAGSGMAELALTEGATVVLFAVREGDGEQPGIRTGVVFATESIYDFHKDMVDEGVEFTLKPMRDPHGRLIARFTDSDGNEYEVIETRGME
ncbi:MAG: Glyoxalase-like domain protein [Methanomassiliicoccales archaeon PtaU1.Bin030]|nr:MAG: Glyoxalase-like domain protein [Methanomassiliicoccales archaeon PtaU1.Bin030]OPY33355.1 MAG: Glyoxalase-like domain protein [Methanomassiliicoccales archaeon PtaU1.Bin030]